jgi:endonuclease YncB( thermonuclease family)
MAMIRRYVASSISAGGMKSIPLAGLILGKEIILGTIKDRREKYGRYLGEIWLTNEKGKTININDEMVKNGFAEYKEY